MALTFPLARYRFEFRITSSLVMPEYGGSALRGAFGHALKKITCLTREPTCRHCPMAGICAYPAIFEPQRPTTSTLAINSPPVPYVIEPPAWGERAYVVGEAFSFHFILVGRALDHLALCVMAWQRVFSQGVGRSEGKGELIGVSLIAPEGILLIHTPGGGIVPHDRCLVLSDVSPPKGVTLEFLTPLRLQDNGHALPPNRLQARTLLMALIRRAALLREYYHDQYTATSFAEMAGQADQVRSEMAMRWRDWTRRSSRQQRTMKLGGCVGQWSLNGDLSPFWDVLRLGTYLHVGKEASFGLGHYRITTHS